MHRGTWFSLLVCFALLPGGRTAAQDKFDQLLKELELEKVRFMKQKETAKDRVLREFDIVIKKVSGMPKGKAADKLALIKRLEANRDAFGRKEDLPENTEVLPVLVQYGATLVKEYKRLSKKFDQVMDALLKAGQRNRADQVRADMAAFDKQHLPGRKHFVEGAEWNGSRFDGANATLFRFRILQLTDNVFKARAEQDIQVAGHPVFDLDGSLDGIAIEVRGCRPIVGNMQMRSCTGVVIGETLLLQVVTVTPKGVPKGCIVLLRRKN